MPRRTRRLCLDSLEDRLVLSTLIRPPFVDTVPQTVAVDGSTTYDSGLVESKTTTGVPFMLTVEIHDPSDVLGKVAVWYGEETNQTDQYNLKGLELIPVTTDDDGDRYVTLTHAYAYAGVYDGELVLYPNTGVGQYTAAASRGYVTAFNVTVTGPPAVSHVQVDQYTPQHSYGWPLPTHKPLHHHVHHHRRGR